MNTAVRVLTSGNAINAVSRAPSLSLPTPDLRIFALLLVILFTALSFIYVKDLGRRLFIDDQDLQQTAQRLVTEHDKLMLEESTWVTPTRVQQIAEQRWNMHFPASEEVVLVDVS